MYVCTKGRRGFFMNRVKFTTTLKNDLVLRLKHEAVERNVPVNRILERMAEIYYADRENAKYIAK